MKDPLNADQEAQAQELLGQLLPQAQEQLLAIARMLVSKDYSQLSGEAEYQLRDLVHQLGADALEAALQQRKKKAT